MSAAEKLQISFVQIDNIRPSLTNPRKTFADIDDLAADLKLRGILLPLIVRPDPTRELAFELVAGERRWRAARKAELLEVPVMVRELNDQEVLEIQIVENAKRSDIHPIEEAEAYRTLHEKHGLSADEIAVKVGKSRRVVYERMQLCSLNSTVREAALSGSVPPTIAVLLARVPVQFQEAALKEITTRGYYRNAGVMTHDEAREFIVSQYTLALSEAQWNLKDEALVPEAGSCAKCLKRTGNQLELFADIAKKDTCTDPDCFAEKKKAFVKLTIAKAQDEGRPTMTAATAKKNLKDGSSVDLDARVPGEGKTYREMLGKKAPAAILAPAAEGVKELVDRAAVEKVLGLKNESAKILKEQADRRREFERQQEDQRFHEAHSDAVMAALSAKLATKHLGKAAWFVIAEAVACELHRQLPYSFVDRWLGGDQDLGTAKDALRKKMAGMKAEQLCALAIDLTLSWSDEPYVFQRGEKGAIKDLCSILGVDEKKLAVTVKAQLKAEGKPGEAPPEPEAEPAAVAKKPKAKKKGGK